MSTIKAAAPAPNEETQKALAGAFIAIKSATKAIKLQGQLPVIQIVGLENVNDSLATAQANADLWANTLSANVQNQLQAIIDYNTMYSALASSIKAAIAEIKTATTASPPAADTMSNLASELGALQSQVQNILYGTGGTKEAPVPVSSLGVYQQLTDYQDKVSKDARVFSGYSTLAFNSKTGISAQIQQYNSDIAADNEALAKDRAMIGGGAAMIVTGALICVVAVALAPETGGATVAVVGGIGVAAIAGGAVMIGLASHDLDSKEADVAAKTLAIATDNAELVSLTTLNSASSNISSYASNIYSALDTIQTSWSQMDNDMADTIAALNLPQAELMKWVAQQSGTSNPTYEVMATILEAQFSIPQSDWAKAASTAQTILNSLANVVEFTLPTGTVPTQEAIAAHTPAQLRKAA